MYLQSKITPHCAVQSESSSYEKVQSELASGNHYVISAICKIARSK